MIIISDGETEVFCDKLALVPRYCRNVRASITANGCWSFGLQYYLRDNNFGLCADCKVWIRNLIEKECLVPR